MLVSEKVVLRRIEKADLWQLWKWHEENELYLFSRIDSFISYDLLNERFSEFFYLKGDFLIESKDGKPLGVISYGDIIRKNRTCEIAFRMCEVDPEQTIALDTLSTMLTFIFGELNLFRVQTYLPEYFSEETAVAEKTGFFLEGKLREHLYRDGSYKDLRVYSLLKKDYQLPPLPHSRGKQ
jgi:RimJ/RimL family protein N-acetyltransferase